MVLNLLNSHVTDSALTHIKIVDDFVMNIFCVIIHQFKDHGKIKKTIVDTY